MNPALVLGSAQWLCVMWGGLAVSGFLGLLALLSPRLFASVATCGKTWVDVDRLLRKLDRKIDIDDYVLHHSRMFGVMVLAAVLLFLTVFAP